MVTQRAVAMAMRVAGKDEGNGEGGKSNGRGCTGQFSRAYSKKKIST